MRHGRLALLQPGHERAIVQFSRANQAARADIAAVHGGTARIEAVIFEPQMWPGRAQEAGDRQRPAIRAILVDVPVSS